MTPLTHLRGSISDLQCGDEVLIGDIGYVVNKITAGGMGLVLIMNRILAPEGWSVHRSRIALKTIRPEFLTESSVALFQRELTVWAAFRNPHIVPLNEILNAGVDGKVAAMDGCLGSLRDCLNLNRSFSLTQATIIVYDILKGLSHAYQQDRVLHLDVKPENVLYDWDVGAMVGKTDRPDIEKWRFMVSDWGIASIKQERLNKVITLSREHEIRFDTFNNMGTCLYMGPERFELGTTSSIGSDVFSLGMIYFEMLTGQLPYTFQASPIEELQSGLYLSSARDILRQNNVPKLIQGFILLCIARSPEERPSSYEDLREYLASAYHGGKEREITVEVVAATDSDLGMDKPVIREGLLQYSRETADKQASNLRVVGREDEAREVLRKHLKEVLQEYYHDGHNPKYLSLLVGTAKQFRELEFAKETLEAVIKADEKQPVSDLTVAYFEFGKIHHALRADPRIELWWYQRAIDAVAPPNCKYVASGRMKVKAHFFAVGPANRSKQYALRDWYVAQCYKLAPDVNWDDDGERSRFVQLTRS